VAIYPKYCCIGFVQNFEAIFHIGEQKRKLVRKLVKQFIVVDAAKLITVTKWLWY
jgi:hypothetical protein